MLTSTNRSCDTMIMATRKPHRTVVVRHIIIRSRSMECSEKPVFFRNDQRKIILFINNQNSLLLGKLKRKEDITEVKSNSLSNDIIKMSPNVSSLPENRNVDENMLDTRGRGDNDDSSTVDVSNVDHVKNVKGQTMPAPSRKVREAVKPEVVEDKAFTKYKRNQTKESKKGKKAPNSKSETYEVRFFELFEYSKHFMKHFTSDKDAALPFYNASSQTAHKDPKTRMLMMDKKPGEFHVNISGDYLVHLNITVVVKNTQHNEKHFLALYLNNQAMLACHEGGFYSPHTSHNSINKHKICNINGLLELRKGDILDIRTMAENMTLRMLKGQNTYFKVVLLNKI